MMTLSNENIFRVTGGIHRSLVNSLHKGQWHGALMFSFIWAWTNGLVNNRDAGDLRCHHAHNDFTVMTFVSVNWIIIGSRNQFGAKPLPQAVMIYYQLDTQKQAHKQQFSVN